jgi:hypothetical protein
MSGKIIGALFQLAPFLDRRSPDIFQGRTAGHQGCLSAGLFAIPRSRKRRASWTVLSAGGGLGPVQLPVSQTTFSRDAYIAYPL